MLLELNLKFGLKSFYPLHFSLQYLTSFATFVDFTKPQFEQAFAIPNQME